MTVAICGKCGNEFPLTGEEDTFSITRNGHTTTLYEHYSDPTGGDNGCGGWGVIIGAYGSRDW